MGKSDRGRNVHFYQLGHYFLIDNCEMRDDFRMTIIIL